MLSLRHELSTSGENERFCAHELLQVIDGHVLEVDLLSAIDVGRICKNANGHPWPGDIWESVRGLAFMYDGENAERT